MARRIAIALALVSAAALGPAPAASASLKAIWGPNRLPDGRNAFPVYRRLGVDVLERQLDWRTVARRRPANSQDPADPAYRWPKDLRFAYRHAGRNEMRIALMVKGTPGWANGGQAEQYAPDDPGDYADFLVAASRKYPRVRHWMIWGEPARQSNWLPLPLHRPTAPRAYAILLDRAYSAIKRQDRADVVIGAMTFTVGDVSPNEWVRWMRLPDGRPPRMDWWGHNAFSNRKPRLSRPTYAKGVRDFSDLDTLHREIARAYRGRRVPRLWISEFTVSSDHANRAFVFYVSRSQQASWLTAAYRIGQRKPWIAGVGWYTLLDDPGPDGLTAGLLDAEGNAKAAYFAYRRLR